MKKRILSVVFAGATALSFATESTVSTAQGLVDALIQHKGDADSRIYLEPGDYDVSGYTMSSNPQAHLSVSQTRLIGKGATARDVVLFGAGEKRLMILLGGGLSNLTISNGVNTADSNGGGGLYTQVVSEMSNVVVTCCRNTANGGGTSLGTWYDSVFEGNVSDANGGAAVGGIFTRCLFTGNTATAGGAVYDGATLTNCTVVGNRATSDGGGVAGSGATAAKVCHVVGGEIAFNEAGGNGGGAYDVTLDADACVHHNTASGSGGGVYNDCSAKQSRQNLCYTTNAVIHSNTCGKYGGGAWLRMADLAFCVVSNNFAHSADGTDQYGLGGGVYAWDAKVDNSYVLFNRVANENTASNARVWGAGIYSGSASNTLIAGNAIVECKTTTRYGAAAYNCALTDCVVRGNYCHGTSYGTGGSVVSAGTLVRCVVTNNIAAYAVRDVPSVKGGVIDGACFSNASSFENTTFTGFLPWRALSDGLNVYTNGLFYCGSYFFEGNCAVTNGLIAGNYVGAVVRADKDAYRPCFANCTFVRNAYGSSIVENSKELAVADFENCLFSENCATNANNGRYWPRDFSNGITSTVRLRNCLYGSNSALNGLVTESNTVTNDMVLFVKDVPRYAAEAVESPYSLTPRSPAVGKGLVRDWMLAATDFRDDSAYPRLRDGKVDIGCYQCWLSVPGLLLMVR